MNVLPILRQLARLNHSTTFSMHASFVIALFAPMAVFASPGKNRPDNTPPELAQLFNGRCTSTRTTTSTVTVTRKVTKTQKPTVTTAISIKIITSTTTILKSISVFSTTSTLFQTSTSAQATTETITDFETITIDQTPPKSTIPAPPGFTPIRSV